VLHIAALSYLKLSEEELLRFQRDLSSVLTYIDKLNEVDSSGASDAEHPYTVPQRFREDRAAPLFPHEAVMKNVPHASDGFILVPKVI
jgi:aspartyl-tRNA(Asn)/glutamyl-tRNA(Gln) amidotransferase subunit C